MKIFKILFSMFFSVFLIIICVFGYFYYYFTTPYLKQDSFFIINKGDSFKTAVNNLGSKNIINEKYNYMFFTISRILYRGNLNIKAGEYFFPSNSSPLDVLRIIRNGKIYYRKITFAEGLSNHSIFKIINESYGLLGDIPNSDIMEGSLLPETYLYTYGETKENLIKRMKQAMVDFIDKEWESKAENLPFKTKQEVLSLASIVEKETGIPEERRKIASVFINRLRKNMKLQSDPTVIYTYAHGDKSLEREIRKSDLSTESEYNTYVIYGIPNKPICNPGKDSIKAVLNPEDTNYLYFVATGNGGHNFSENLEKHNGFVEKYRNIIKEKISKIKANNILNRENKEN